MIELLFYNIIILMYVQYRRFFNIYLIATCFSHTTIFMQTYVYWILLY
jgi:hypothetical protein